jgi:hypothetical protein
LKKTCVQFLSSTCEGTFAAMSHVMSSLCIATNINVMLTFLSSPRYNFGRGFTHDMYNI